MADTVFTRAKNEIFSQNLNLVSEDIKVMLVNPNFVPDPDMEFVDDGTTISASNFEVSGTGYEAGNMGSGRMSLINKFFQVDPATNKSRFFASNLSWNPINAGLVGGAVLIKEGLSGDTGSLMIAHIDSGGFPQNTDGGQLDLNWNSNGIFSV